MQDSVSARITSPLRKVALKSYSKIGHRTSYEQVLATALRDAGFDLDPSATGTVADFFPMLDDNKTAFCWKAVTNWVRGKPTVGLFFRPAECFLTTSLKYRFKRTLFGGLRRLPGTEIITILPFALDERFSTIATGWIHDAQFWDLDYLAPAPHTSEIAERVRTVARDRRVVVALGGQNQIKGFDFFCNLWIGAPQLHEKFLFVAAGKIAPGLEELSAKVSSSGGLIFDRSISDEELISLYKTADLVWSCYAPNYNQSSGILGRAFQLGKPSLVREGSYLVTFSELLGHPALSLPYGQVELASTRLSLWKPELPDGASISRKVEEMRGRDLKLLAEAFGRRLEGPA